MTGHYHIPKASDFERHEGVDLARIAQSEIARLREEIEHERYNVEKTAQEGAKQIKELRSRIEALVRALETMTTNLDWIYRNVNGDYLPDYDSLADARRVLSAVGGSGK